MMPMVHPGDQVVVEPVPSTALVPGDWVVVRAGGTALLHRYLGRWRGCLLTKGDGNRMLDSLWTSHALIGRATEAWRDGDCYYRRESGRLVKERMLAYFHLTTAVAWHLASRLRHAFIALLLLAVSVGGVAAAVTIVDFAVEAGEQEIFVNWQTASEVGNLGFYLWRREGETGDYVKLPIERPEEQFIPSQDLGAGFLYEFTDNDVTPGVTYLYKLQDVPSDGSPGEFTEALSVTLPVAPTPTPTATPEPTATSTSAPTATPVPEVRFWADKTELAAGDCSTVQWQASGVQALFLNGTGVGGQGARTFCPCESQTHTLTAHYPSGRGEDFTVDLTVTGRCDDRRATATQPPTVTAPPNEGSEVVAQPTTTRRPTATRRQRSTATPRSTAVPQENGDRTAEVTVVPVVPPTAVEEGLAIPPSPRATTDVDDAEAGLTGDPAVVQGALVTSRTFSPTLRWLILAGFVGLGLIVGGVWFWRRG